MSGTYTQMASRETCGWDASLTSGTVRTSQSSNPGKDPEPDYSKLDAKKKRAAREQDARSFLTTGAAAAQYCTYSSQMVAAGRFSQAAEAYRLLGDSARQRKAAKLAANASAKADECDHAKKTKRTAQNNKAKQSAKAKAEPATCKPARDYAKQLADKGQLKASLKIRVEIMKQGCKIR